MTRTPDPKRLADRIESLKQDRDDDALPGLTAVLRGEAEIPPAEDLEDGDEEPDK